MNSNAWTWLVKCRTWSLAWLNVWRFRLFLNQGHTSRSSSARLDVYLEVAKLMLISNAIVIACKRYDHWRRGNGQERVFSQNAVIKAAYEVLVVWVQSMAQIASSLPRWLMLLCCGRYSAIISLVAYDGTKVIDGWWTWHCMVFTGYASLY